MPRKRKVVLVGLELNACNPICGKMKEKGLEVHPSFRAKLNNKVQESKNGLNKK